MRKILLLAPFDLFPPIHGGSTSVYYILKHISKDNQVYTLLSHLYSIRGKIDLVHQNIQIQYCPRSIFDHLKVLSFLVNPYYFKKAYEIMKNYDCDIIQCQVLWTAFAGIFLKKMLSRPLILVEHNVEYLKFKSLGKSRLFTYCLKTIEKMVCRLADKIVVFSRIDQSKLKYLYNLQEDKIEVITPCPDIDVLKENKASRRSIRKRYGASEEDIILTFVGNLDYIPNMIAVKHIVEKIYPVIIQKYSSSKFLIIGQNSKNVQECKRDNIIFTSYLDTHEFVGHLSASDIIIVPIDSGSGIRKKILDAAACSRAIVSTRKGCEGLSFIDGKEILLADEVDEQFIANIIRLIEDKKLRETMGKNARERILKQYTWKSAIQKFTNIYRELEGRYED